jgi:hypothetical protein
MLTGSARRDAQLDLQAGGGAGLLGRWFQAVTI